MVEAMVFPVFIVSKDRKTLRRFTSLEELCHNLEQIDVENEEYDAWDGAGFRLEMFVKNEKSWLGIRPTIRGVPEFREALLRFAAASGVRVEPASLDSWTARELFDAVDQAFRAKIQQLPWYQRLLRRF